MPKKKNITTPPKMLDISTSLRPLFSLLLILAIFVAVFSTLNSFKYLTQVCPGEHCQLLKGTTSNQPLGSQSETLKIKLLVERRISKISPDLNSSVKPQIVVLQSNTGAVEVDIPMRNGSTLIYPVFLPQVKSNSVIEISIFDSREFLVTLDNSLVYSHRYITPVFFADPAKAIKIVQSDPHLEISIIPNSINISISNPPLFNSAGKIVSILIMFLTIALIVRNLLVRFFPQENRKIQLRLPVSAVLIFWTICIGSWLLRPRDDTGGSNPSPFAQIGPAFSDVMQIFQAGKFSTPYIYGAVNYPPTALYLIRLFGPLSIGFAALFVLALPFGILMWLTSGFGLSRKGFRRYLQSLPIICSYPIIFALVRGNLDLLVVGLVGAALHFYLGGKYRRTALGLLAIVAALKFWPFVLIIFVVKKRDYFGAVIIVSGALLLTFLFSYLLGYHTISEDLKIIKDTLGLFNSTASINTFIYSYSLGGLLLALSVFITSHFSIHPNVHELSQGYHFIESRDYLLILMTSIVLIVILIWKSKRDDSIILYCSSLALFESSVSYAYRASILIICLLFRVNQSHSVFRVWKQPGVHGDKPLQAKVWGGLEVFSWICILAPTTFYYVKGTGFSTSSVLQPSALILILIIERDFERRLRLSNTVLDQVSPQLKEKVKRPISIKKAN